MIAGLQRLEKEERIRDNLGIYKAFQSYTEPPLPPLTENVYDLNVKNEGAGYYVVGISFHHRFITDVRVLLKGREFPFTVTLDLTCR